MNEFEKVLIDSQKEVGKSNKRKDKIIVLLIVLMFLEAIVGYSGFIWYESQFDYVTTEQETQDVDLSTEGDNANAEYNNIMTYREINIMIEQHTMNSRKEVNKNAF